MIHSKASNGIISGSGKSSEVALGDFIKGKIVGQKLRCQPTDRAQAVLKKMKRKGVEYLPVFQGGKLVGIVWDRDLLEGMVNQGPTQRIHKLMRKKPPVGGLKDSPKEAIQLMEKHGTACVTVVDNGKVAGIVTLADLAAEKSLSHEAGQAYHQLSRKGEKKESGYKVGMMVAGVLLGAGALLALKSRD
ncbi:CBS domain-containing protein [Marininema halotolerans]|uniref:CBS domain-containing protein n=1 Tax=Marininema halotolerans TaxID=1155944 RepID=A0A1I6RMW8_9BACL|nr:CBS domain-containing protein [Marininema halotolerans]SFS66071.1 CBS domain-containing protein [Marininema halotolerans]